jgi:hypothetical protein
MIQSFAVIMLKIKSTSVDCMLQILRIAITLPSSVLSTTKRFATHLLLTAMLNLIDILWDTFPLLTCPSIGLRTPLFVHDALHTNHYQSMSNRSRLKIMSAHSLRSLFPRSNSTFVETASTAADFSFPFRSILSISHSQTFIFLLFLNKCFTFRSIRKSFLFVGGMWDVSPPPSLATCHLLAASPHSAPTSSFR